MISDTLPTGMSFNAATAALSGTPTQTGSFPITVTANDTNGCKGCSAPTLSVVCPMITLSPASLPGGIVGYPYSQTVTASGSTGTYTYGVTAGTVPPGLALSSGGTLSGTAAAAGTFSFTVTATDTCGCKGSIGCTVRILLYNWTLKLQYLSTAHLASGSFGYPTKGIVSAVVDANTLNDPLGCAGS